mmetsp:Transcript_22583/g.57634  ORF Transcript_22583/g.57634 Transcript_22583/m.57634 type:complete len:560 (+) Transcript_22583:155-1834(+)
MSMIGGRRLYEGRSRSEVFDSKALASENSWGSLLPTPWLLLQKCFHAVVGRKPAQDEFLTVFEQANARTMAHDKKASQHIAATRSFEWVCLFVIFLNAITTGLDIDLGRPDRYPENEDLFFYMQSFFTLLFVFEACVRLHHLRWKYFLDRWCLLDFLIIEVSLLDASIQILRGEASGHGPLAFAFRIIRLVRPIRSIRMVTAFKELWLLVHGFLTSIHRLVFVVTCILLAGYFLGVFATYIVGRDYDLDMSWPKTFTHFGSVTRSMLTFFQFATQSDWNSKIVRPLQVEIPGAQFPIMAFIYFARYGLVTCLVALFVQKVSAVAASNYEVAADKRENKDKQLAAKMLYEIFVIEESTDILSDADNIVLDEFNELVLTPSITTMLIDLDIPLHDAEELFSIIDADNRGAVSAQEIAKAVVKMKGVAKKKDLHVLHCTISYLTARINDIVMRVDRFSTDVETVDERMETILRYTSDALAGGELRAMVHKQSAAHMRERKKLVDTAANRLEELKPWWLSLQTTVEGDASPIGDRTTVAERKARAVEEPGVSESAERSGAVQE